MKNVRPCIEYQFLSYFPKKNQLSYTCRTRFCVFSEKLKKYASLRRPTTFKLRSKKGYVSFYIRAEKFG
jgi:hypothetical protein